MLELILSTLRMATPLIFVALAGLLSERGGVVNLALEAFLLLGAFTAASTAYLSGSWGLTWITVSLAGLLLATIFAFLVVILRGSAIIVAMALNLLVMGIIPMISKYLFNSTGSTPVLPIEMRLQYFPTVLVLLITLGLSLYSRFTLSGLRWRAAGESAFAVQSAQLSVNKIRFLHLLAAGVIASWGGIALSLFLASSYSPLMSGGRGFIALAALILGRWKPWPTFGACLLFGLFEATQMRLQNSDNLAVHVPLELVQILPYILTLVVLVIIGNKGSAPAELSHSTEE